MAGPFEQSLEEVHILFDALFLPSESIISNSNHHVQQLSSTLSPVPRRTISVNSLITSPPSHLELRQNNPQAPQPGVDQDCQNLIIASVDRATVEISRTIIALNATFSQQLQQASISASNGIKAAQDSASSTIGVVVKSADIATSSASFSVNLANRAVVSATSALADFSLSSSSDVASLSSSLGLLQASLSSIQASGSAAVSAAQASALSLQASASAAIAAAQAALASATGSAAAHASSLLASANANLPPTATQTGVGAGQTIPSQPPSNISLTPAQIAGIIVGAVAASALLSLAIYFAIMKLKRRGRDSYMDEKYNPRSPKEVPSRSSSVPRTGNAITLKFSPPKSSIAPLPTRSALRKEVRTSMEQPYIPQIEPLEFQTSASRVSTSGTRMSNSAVRPLGSTNVDNRLQRPPVAATEWPLPTSSINQTENGSFSFELPVPEASGALTEENRILGADNSSRNDIEKEQNLSNPFSAPHDNLREKLFDHLDDATQSIYSIPDGQAFDFAIKRDSSNETIEAAHEAANPFNDRGTNSVDESWDNCNYSPAQSVVEMEMDTNTVKESEPNFTDSPQHQHIGEPVKPTVPGPEPSEIPSLLQLQEAFMEKSSTRIERPITQILESKTSKVTVGNGKDFTATQPLFLENYNPPMPEVEKVLSPPPRRRPSLGSVRPLRKMLPPRQETVSPQRRKKATEGEKSNSAEEEPSSSRPSKRSLPIVPKSVASDEPQSPRPSSIELRSKTLSPLRRNPVLVDIPADAEVVPVVMVSKDVEQVSALMAEEAKIPPHQQTASPRSVLVDDKSIPLAAGYGLEATEIEDRQHRGRSMMRTSDIFEARLSMKSQIQEDQKPLQALEARLSAIAQNSQSVTSSNALKDEVDRKEEIDRGKSPLRRNPVDISSIPKIPKIQRSKTLPPPRQHIRRENVAKRRSRTLSPVRLVNKFLQLDRPPISREESPLRRNPTRRGKSPLLPFAVDSLLSNAPRRVPKVASNGLFAQSMSIFQNLASQNPQDAMMASTEVTQRAIAGIYIPGSLREQAVRTVSKSRERR